MEMDPGVVCRGNEGLQKQRQDKRLCMKARGGGPALGKSPAAVGCALEQPGSQLGACGGGSGQPSVSDAVAVVPLGGPPPPWHLWEGAGLEQDTGDFWTASRVSSDPAGQGRHCSGS